MVQAGSKREVKKMKAIPITASRLKEMVNDPHENIVFRQTRNWELKRWSCVQRRGTDKAWSKVANEKEIIKKEGWAYAIWRLRKIMAYKMDNAGRRHWKTEMYKIRHGVYMTYYLICKRRVYSFQGTY